MDFRKLKKWFQRRRRGDRGRAVASPASRASGQTRAPANVSGRKTDGDRSSPAPKAVKKTAVNPAAGGISPDQLAGLRLQRVEPAVASWQVGLDLPAHAAGRGGGPLPVEDSVVNGKVPANVIDRR